MGNEKSGLSGLEIDEKAIEITDFWLHHNANITRNRGSASSNLSVFISEPALHSSGSFGKPTPLEKASKNLMIHRHPCILKYISSWRKNSLYYLVTEEVKPLAQVLSMQTSLQICIGLHNILKALIFLHDTALATHLNVCTSSIYVNPEGSWRLAGLEYLVKVADFNETYLKRIKQFRCEKTIAPEEEELPSLNQSHLDPVAIDQFAFGILAEDVLRLKTTDEVPALLQFKDFCKKSLQNPDAAMRSKLSSILQHPFFTHDFINIHAFLMELPLKNDVEKEEFFSGLVERLKQFPEKIVAEQLGKLMLSRMVLLNSTAQTKLLPFVLKPQKNDEDTEGLFQLSTFRSYLVPKLLQMFCVRDISIRLLLLSHLNSFVHAFQIEDLKKKILPELLLGIKDDNDELVSVTLRSLADLVPILGAAGVIGGHRGKLFTDGRPNKRLDKQNDSLGKESTSELVLTLPERPSPDGGEDRLESPVNILEDETTWSDWDTQETNLPNSNQSLTIFPLSDPSPPSCPHPESDEVHLNHQKPGVTSSSYQKKQLVIEDINELDIKHSKSVNCKKEEEDFFTDMEPVIQKTEVLHINSSKSVFDVEDDQSLNVDAESGWNDEDFNDWGADNDANANDDDKSSPKIE